LYPAYAISRLTLLGTIHRDPQGLKRLVEALRGLSPHVITLEFSTYGLRYRLKKKSYVNTYFLKGLHELRGIDRLSLSELKKLLRATGIGGIRALLDLPFEYKGASFYSRNNGSPLYCVDLSSYSRQLLGNIGELLEPKNLKKVVAFETRPLQETATREYKRAEALLFDGKQSPWLRPVAPNEVWKNRERIMASRIKKMAARHPSCHIVHISGWQHLAAGPETLFSLLEDLMPKRVLLGNPNNPEPPK
jgi:hypothetical protein